MDAIGEGGAGRGRTDKEGQPCEQEGDEQYLIRLAGLDSLHMDIRFSLLDGQGLISRTKVRSTRSSPQGIGARHIRWTAV